MGGFESGRYRTRTAGYIDGALRIDIRTMRRDGFLDGLGKYGIWRWTYGGSPTGSASIGVNLDGRDAGGVLRIEYALNGDPRSDRVTIVTAACRFGGRRFYFLCPVRGHRCEVLAFAHGRWASRQSQKLAYASQSDDALGRLHRARGKAEDRAFGRGGRPRPRGENRERLFNRWAALEEATDTLFELEAARRFGALGIELP